MTLNWDFSAENLQTCEACRDALNKIKARLVDSVFQKVLENILYHKFCQKLPYEKSLVSFPKIILFENFCTFSKNEHSDTKYMKLSLLCSIFTSNLFFHSINRTKNAMIILKTRVPLSNILLRKCII